MIASEEKTRGDVAIELEPADEMSLDDARAALERHFSGNLWYRHGLAAGLPITSFDRFDAFHVVLESFTETRRKRKVYDGYGGGTIDGSDRGRPPSEWEMPVQVPGFFVDAKTLIDVPHSSSVDTCPRCDGKHDVCPLCDGSGQARCFEQLEVVWGIRVAERVIENAEYKADVVPQDEGIAIVREETDRIEPCGGGCGGGPFRGCFGRVNPLVNAAIDDLLAEAALPGHTKIRRQRVTVFAVPVWEARYDWGTDVRRFWVHGTNHRVSARRYPLSTRTIAGLIAGAILYPLLCAVYYLVQSHSLRLW